MLCPRTCGCRSTRGGRPAARHSRREEADGPSPAPAGSSSAETMVQPRQMWPMSRRLAAALLLSWPTHPALAVMVEGDPIPAGFKSSALIPAEEIAEVVMALQSMDTPLQRYYYLTSLRYEKPGLFFAALKRRPTDILPVVYTPGVGDACLNWGLLPMRPEGCTLTAFDRGGFAAKLRALGLSDVQAIVVTDGQRILGLGDLGANGMGISVGKCLLYTSAAGLRPTRVLPVALDVGCNSPELRRSGAYVGIQQERLIGEEYFAFVDEFYQACRAVFGPATVIHWEDFGSQNAGAILEKYRPSGPTFNDDIQSTAAVALACILGACKRSTVPNLADQSFVFAGAGQAALGIASMLVDMLGQVGLSESEAKARIWMMDSRGLLVDGRGGMTAEKREFAQPENAALRRGVSYAGADLLQVVARIKPTTLVGAAGKGGIFTPEVLGALSRSMGEAPREEGGAGAPGALVSRQSQNRLTPIVLALSNPTSASECSFQEAWEACNGNVVFASGSPFPPVQTAAGEVTASQANNAMIFPGVTLGTVLSGAGLIPDTFFAAAARALAEETSSAEADRGNVIPAVARIADAALAVAVAVCIQSSVEMLSNGGSNARVFKAVANLLAGNGSDHDGDANRRLLDLRRAIDSYRL